MSTPEQTFDDNLARDINMKLPDEAWQLDYVERYRRVRFNEDFATLDGNRTFLHAYLEIPLPQTGGVFSWALWVEVSPQEHDRFLSLYAQDREGDMPVITGTIANEIPGYEGSLGECVELLFETGCRPGVRVMGDSLLAKEQKSGASALRHQAIHESLFGADDDEEDENER